MIFKRNKKLFNDKSTKPTNIKLKNTHISISEGSGIYIFLLASKQKSFIAQVFYKYLQHFK